MRTLTKTLILLLITAIGAFTILALSRMSIFSQASEARIDLADPCASDELKMMEDEYRQNPDAVSERYLLEKIEANETAMAECARLAIAYPPAAKPQDQIGVLLPTLTSLRPLKSPWEFKRQSRSPAVILFPLQWMNIISGLVKSMEKSCSCTLEFNAIAMGNLNPHRPIRCPREPCMWSIPIGGKSH